MNVSRTVINKDGHRMEMVHHDDGSLDFVICDRDFTMDKEDIPELRRWLNRLYGDE